MNKILSWKITGGVYAYIYPVNNGKYISNRIAEDSPIWQSVISEISNWDASEYRANFDKMAAEVQTQYGYTVAWDDKFFDFVDENAVGGVNIVLLSGKDGEGNGGGNGLGTGPGSEVYEEFNNAIDAKLQEIREDIEKQNEDVKNFVEEKVTETILDAKETISTTKEELNSVRKELKENLDSAKDALNKAANLFNTAEGGIDPEAIKDALSSVNEYGEWLERYSGDITTLKTDYDTANQKMGSIGEAENVTDGLFARFATSLNVVSGTAGTVNSWMVASAATIGDMASWYDTIESSATEAISFINASAGVISQVINYIDSDEFGNEITSNLERSMCAHTAEIIDKIQTETESAITNVTRDMEAVSGKIEDTIVRLDKATGELTSLGQRMDASQQEIEEWMTITDSAMSMAYDMRESWSVESGKLSTVANLIAQTDDEGNVLYFVSAATGEEIPVFITDEFSEETGERIYTTNADGSGYKYYEPSVYTKLSSDVVSYIQQTASAITLSVTNADAITAAIKLAIKEDAEGDKAIISMVADEVVIDADVIAKAISAKTANIGGIIMGNGVIQSMAEINDKPYFYLDGTDGKLFAQNAVIQGEIIATSLKIGSHNTDIDKYIKDQLPENDGEGGGLSETDVNGLINEFVNSDEFKNSLLKGYVTEDDFNTWKNGLASGLTKEQLDEIKQSIVDSEINLGVVSATTENGGVKYTVSIGGKTFDWEVYSTDDFLLLGTEYGDNFIVSKDGLLEASNAVIYGKVYSSEGNIGGLELEGKKLLAKDSKKHIDYYTVTETFSSCFSFNSGNTVSMEKIVEDGIPYQDIFIIEEGHPGLSGNTDTSGIFTGNTIFDFGVEEGYFEILKHTSLNGGSSNLYDILYCETKPYDLTGGNTKKLDNVSLDKTVKSYETYDVIDTEKIKYIKTKVYNKGYEGWKILGIESKNEYDNEQTYALINSSNDYSDDKMGKLVIGAGPIDDQCGLNRYYEYKLLEVNSAVTEKISISYIYLKKVYSVNNGDKSDIEVDAYRLVGENRLEQIDDYVFYYINEPYVESGDSGTTLYRDRIYAKSTLNKLLAKDKNNDTGSTYSLRNPETVLGAYNTPTTDVHLKFEVDVREDFGGGGGGGTVTFTPNTDGTGTGGTNTGGADLPTIVFPDVGYYKPTDVNDFKVKMWDGSLTSLQVIRPVINIGAYEYTNKSIIIDTTDFNTKIYSDGTIISKNLIVDDGYFAGEINSDGVFKGELKDVTGTLKNVSITADTINSSFVINDEKSFNAVSGTKTYFKVNTEKVSSGATSENWTVDSFSWDKTNKNGTNAGKTYNNEKILLKVPINVTSNTTITIPSMSGYVKRYTPRKKVNKESAVYVNCYVFYTDNSVSTLFNKIVKVAETRGSQTVNFTTPETVFKGNVEKSGFLIIEFGMNIHLSTYSWLGADKAAGHVYFNSSTSKVNVSHSAKTSGVHIGSDGISMFNESGKYGIIINESGIKLVKNGTVTSL